MILFFWQTTAFAVGLGLAAIGIVGRSILKYAPAVTQNLEKKLASLPKADLSTLSNALKVEKYYKGGFETKMSRREASLILGVSPNANKIKIKEAHKRIMNINHPDRPFGSPYIASKINEGFKSFIIYFIRLVIFYF